MAGTITLRAYLDELDTMLENDSPTEVVSHCRYILQHHPQNLETYRLLGKAFLQKAEHEALPEHYSEAAAMFQRVLSVQPGDYIAHLGLSEIREQEGAIRQAIWHMERAYEQMPGNAALQDALRQLYIKRDGEDNAPQKIQLTRGALARQYIKGQLYDQALIELRKAVEQTPERMDLQVLLSETLWDSQHHIEAGEIAFQILKELPYCLPAHRILAQLWLEHDRPADARPFLEQLEALDPYLALHVAQPAAEDAQVALVERLDYSTEAAAALQETPDWVQDLGDLGSGDVFSAPPAEEPAASPPTPSTPPDRIDTEAIFGDGTPDWMSDLDASAEEQGALDWQAGGEVPTGEPEAVTADWLSDEPAPESEEEPPEEGQIPDWFSEVVSTEPEAVEDEAAPVDADWLAAKDESEQAVEQVPAESLDWEQDIADVPAETPDWLADAAELPEEPEAAFDAMEWSEPEDDTPAEAEPAQAPDWLADVSEEAPEELEPPREEPEIAAEGPDWLEGDIDQADIDSLMGEQAGEIPDFPPDFQDEEPAESDELSSGFTDLLHGIDQAEAQSEFEAKLDSVEPEQPDWLSSAEEAEPALPAEPAVEDAEEQPEEDAVSDEDLETLRQASMPPPDMDLDAFFAAAQGEEEPEPVQPEPTTPDEREQAPDWMTEPEYDFFAPPADEDEELELGQTPFATHPLDEEREQPEDAAAAEPAEPAVEPEAAPDELFAEQADMAEPPKALGWLGEQEQAEEAEAALDWLGAAEDAPAADDVSEDAGDALDWVNAPEEAEGGDWLASFAKPSPEAEESFEAAPPPPVEEAAPAPSEDEWLAEMPDFELEAVEEEASPEEIAEGFEALEDDDFFAAAPSEQATAEPPQPVEEETEDEDEQASGTNLLKRMQSAEVEESQSPEWLADMEPVAAEETPQTEDEFIDQPYDPFESGSAEQVPEYATAKETGILQPDEQPAWMTAFTGEEMPPEEEVEEEAFAAAEFDTGWDEFPHEEPEPVADEPPSITDSFEDLDLRDWEDEEELLEPQDMEPVGAEDEDEAEDEEGMPEWLVAITSSESDKLEEDFLSDLEAYSPSAEETGVLQPGTSPDWLTEVGEPPAAAEEMDMFPEATTEDDEFLAEFDLTGLEDDMPEADDLFADLQAAADEQPPEPEDVDLEQDILAPEEAAIDAADDLLAELEQAAAAPPDDFFAAPEEQPAKEVEDIELFDEFEAEREEIERLADSTMEMEAAVAQADDLAHTSETTSAPMEESDVIDWAEDDLDEIDADDFSFDDVAPAWLRQPTENEESGASASAGTDETSDTPEWLRNVFEDDEPSD